MKMTIARVLVWAIAAGVSVAELDAARADPVSTPAAPMAPKASTTGFTVTSTDLAAGRVPARLTCDAEGLTPTLSWTGGPEDTESYAVVATDPDARAGEYTHWLVWNIGPAVRTIDPGNAIGFETGTNSSGQTGWAAICPPKRDRAHRYEFTVFALDRHLDLPRSATRADLVRAMSGHVLAQSAIMASYQRVSSPGT